MSRQKDKGSRFESRVVQDALAEGLSAKKQPGSGQYAGYPNDAVIESLLVECKAGYTRVNVAGERRFALEVEWIEKVLRHAREDGKAGWVLAIRPNGIRRWWALVDGKWLLALLAENKRLREELKKGD